jgi:hypothetical protein
MSKERSTSEDINLEQHALRFQFSFPEPAMDPSLESEILSGPPPVVMKKRKPIKVRNVLGARRIASRQMVAKYYAEVALRKYNKSNSTKVFFYLSLFL